MRKSLEKRLYDGLGDVATPTQATAAIIQELLANLPVERQREISEAIEFWAQEWTILTCSVAMETSER